MLAFVLGGGGSRGALQAGALQTLSEAGIQPDMVIGTSVGALNGAFVAGDPTRDGAARLHDVWLNIRGQDIYPGQTGTMIWNMARGHQSLFENDSWHSLLQRLMPAERFSDLPIPCYAVAVDIETADIVVFGDDKSDRLIDGLMSSSALTPIHPAWEIDGRHYVDGGFGALLPIRQAVERGATEIIALNLTNRLQRYDQIKTSADMLVHNIDLLMLGQVRADLQYAETQPNLRIKTIDLRAPTYLLPTDFSHTAELLEVGRGTTLTALQEGLWSSPNRVAV